MSIRVPDEGRLERPRGLEGRYQVRALRPLHSQIDATAQPDLRDDVPAHQSELIIGATATPVTLHFSIHSPVAGKSAQLASACCKWSATPASVS